VGRWNLCEFYYEVGPPPPSLKVESSGGSELEYGAWIKLGVRRWGAHSLKKEGVLGGREWKS
jgi:hypothetical protein